MPIAYATGVCSLCSGIIANGSRFEWGEQRGSRVCEACLNAIEDAAIDDEEGRAPMSVLDEPEPQWSDYQLGVYDFGLHSDENGMIIAVAGSGKTTVAKELCIRIGKARPGDQIAYLVFNKRNADEAQAKLPRNVKASTFHSACFSAINVALHRPKVEPSKMSALMRDLFDRRHFSREEATRYGGPLLKLVGLGKNNGIRVYHSRSWKSIIDHYGIDVDPEEGLTYEEQELTLATMADELLKDSNEQTTIIDYDDMLYLTVKLDLPLPRYDMVIVDEAQDTNTIQRAILKKMIKPNGGRLIAVGNPRQGIYGFRGADADAMEIIEKEFRCKELPLSINYRCATSIVAHAKRYCPQLEPWDQSPEGSVESLSKLDLETVLPTDAFLSRTNAPLLPLAMALLRRGKGCKVLGKDIGQGLVELIKKLEKRYKVRDLDGLESALRSWAVEETKKLLKRDQEDRVHLIEDNMMSIQTLVDNLEPGDASIEGLIRVIGRIFSDDAGGLITLATVHKAKGMEWPRVFILNPSLMPLPYAKLPWQLQQEYNILYVAVTRAQVDLRYVELKRIEL